MALSSNTILDKAKKVDLDLFDDDEEFKEFEQEGILTRLER